MEGVLGAELAAIGCGVAAVVKAVAHPAGAGKLDPLEHIARLFTGFEVHDADLLPVAAGGIAHDGDVLVVVRGAGQAGCHCAVFAERIGVEEHFVFAVQSFSDVPHALVLEAVVLADVVAVANLPRGAHFFIVEDLLVAVVDGAAERDAIEVAAGYGVLGFHPGARLFAAVVFEPPVGVGDIRSEVGVHHAVLARVRVFEGLHVVGFSGGGACNPKEGHGERETKVAHNREWGGKLGA